MNEYIMYLSAANIIAAIINLTALCKAYQDSHRKRSICMSDDYRMRKCGDGWEYCNGKCSECPKTHIATTNHT